MRWRIQPSLDSLAVVAPAVALPNVIQQQRHSNRHYFRVMTADFQVFELHHDMAVGVWVLDVVHN